MNARQIVNKLLEEENDEISPEMVQHRLRSHPEIKWAEFIPPGFKAVSYWKKRGYNTQFDSEPIGNWKGHLTFYEGPEPYALVAAYYRTPCFKSERAKGKEICWGGGNDLIKVPAHKVRSYWNKLLQMFKKYPDPWKIRYIPHMPEANYAS